MAIKSTLREILEMAIHKEADSRSLYADLSQLMNDEAAKDAFQELARQEQGHQNLLEKYLRGELTKGALRHTQPVDYKIAETLKQPEISPTMNLKDIFTLAAIREKLSHELYLGLAGIHPDGEVKRLFEELAAQELEHKRRVEFLYTEVAFPQTAGG